MKNFQRMQGVTLLEIMLVLAIAAMVIVMSIRYYQSASTNQKINAALGTITGIVAAGENYLSATGTMPKANADVTPYLPDQKWPTSPWGGTALGDLTQSGTGYKFSINTSTTSDCTALSNAVKRNGKLAASACSGSTLTVDVQP